MGFHQLMLNAVYRRNVTQMVDHMNEKAIVRPDCCAIDWIHFPTVCFNPGHQCKGTGGKVVYAHFKEWKRAKDGTELPGIQDMFFVNESVLLRRQLCEWLGAVNLSCEPVDWQPPAQITGEKTPSRK